MGMRWPASRPAKESSGIPSGSGMTAATVMAGGPPMKTFTRNCSAALHGLGMMGADAAVDLVVQAGLRGRLVISCPRSAPGTYPGWISA